MNAVRHKDSGKAEWGERDVVPLSPAVRKANRRNKVVPRACPPLVWRACPWGSTVGALDITVLVSRFEVVALCAEAERGMRAALVEMYVFMTYANKGGLAMEKQALVGMLNEDIADEHAAIVRYLIHGYLEGEDTPLGAKLISLSREEMWHMHWLGLIIGELGDEPNLTPAAYPHDPTSRETMLRSYIEYEEKLVPYYNGQAEKMEDPHVKRVFQRLAWESAIHARQFQRKLGKLSAEEAAGLPGAESELPKELIDKLQAQVADKYTEMLQHLRYSWVFQRDTMMGWRIMDQAMEKMKQLAHFAEPIAEDGVSPEFKAGKIDTSRAIGMALAKALEDVQGARERHAALKQDGEVQKHSGLVINLDLTIQQEEYQGAELEDWGKKGRQ